MGYSLRKTGGVFLHKIRCSFLKIRVHVHKGIRIHPAHAQKGRHMAQLMVSSENSGFCQQAVTTANSPLEAASLLESSQQGSSVQHALPRSHYQTGPLGGDAPGLPLSTELRGLFNWSGRGKCQNQSSSGGPSKKTKSQTWTHSWVCLSGMTRSLMQLRESLKIAGLGE